MIPQRPFHILRIPTKITRYIHIPSETLGEYETWIKSPARLLRLCGAFWDSFWRKRIGVEPTNDLSTVHQF